MPHDELIYGTSRNTPPTSKQLSKDIKISCVIDRSWFKQESPGLNPDCSREVRLLSKKYFNMLWCMICLEP